MSLKIKLRTLYLKLDHKLGATQRYFCHDCRRYSRDAPQPNGYTDSERETILRAYDERSSLRGLTRTFGVARNTVTSWLKKRGAAATAGSNTDRARCRRP